MTTKLILGVIIGCNTVQDKTIDIQPTDPLSLTETTQTFSGQVLIEPLSNEADEMGVWLKRDDPHKWLIDNYPSLLFERFEGIPVQVSGAPLPTDASAPPRFEIHTLRVADPTSSTDLHAMGPEKQMNGHIETRRGAEGTKSEGSTWRVFVSDAGTTYEIVNPINIDATSRTIRARTVERSPFVATRAGPALWITAPGAPSP